MEEIEGAILGVGLKQAVETEQRRQQRRDPQDRRSDAGEQIRVWPDGEGHDRDERQEEHDAHRAGAADAARDAPFAQEKRGRADDSSRGGRPRQASAASIEPQRLMRRGDDQSAVRAMIAHGDGEFLA